MKCTVKFGGKVGERRAAGCVSPKSSLPPQSQPRTLVKTGPGVCSSPLGAGPRGYVGSQRSGVVTLPPLAVLLEPGPQLLHRVQRWSEALAAFCSDSVNSLRRAASVAQPGRVMSPGAAQPAFALRYCTEAGTRCLPLRGRKAQTPARQGIACVGYSAAVRPAMGSGLVPGDLRSSGKLQHVCWALSRCKARQFVSRCRPGGSLHLSVPQFLHLHEEKLLPVLEEDLESYRSIDLG